LARIQANTIRTLQEVVDSAAANTTASQAAAYAALQAARSTVGIDPVTLGGVKTFASGGDFGGGLRLVGENGPELEVTGPSRIYNAEQTRALLAGDSNENLALELQALRQLLQMLIADQRAGLGAIASSTLRMANIFRDVTPNRT